MYKSTKNILVPVLWGNNAWHKLEVWQATELVFNTNTTVVKIYMMSGLS